MSEKLGTKYLDMFIPCPAALAEILQAELFELGFEGTWEQDEGVHGYIPGVDYNAEAVQEMLNNYGIAANAIQVTNMQNINWNEFWEKAYDPILVKDKVLIRAEFHTVPEGIEYDIVIQPKMSFGTGHHDSTQLIVEQMLDMDFKGQSVIDVGCGTGVLGILAIMMGAESCDAIDNNPWSYENSVENAERNQVAMNVELSDIESYGIRQYDIVLSNITRNINHANLPKYQDMVKPGGTLVMSGFFDHDFDFINEQAIKHGFRLLNRIKSAKNWTALSYQKT